MVTITVKRIWEIQVAGEVLTDLAEKGYDLGDMIWALSEQSNSGSMEPMYLVKYVNEEDGVESEPCWGTYNDVMGDGAVELYKIEKWYAQEEEGMEYTMR